MTIAPLSEKVCWDIFPHVFQFLNVKTVLRISSVCKAWKEISNEPYLWSSLYAKKKRLRNIIPLNNSREEFIALYKERKLWNNSLSRCQCNFFKIDKRTFGFFDMNLTDKLMLRSLIPDLRHAEELGLYYPRLEPRKAAQHLVNTLINFQDIVKDKNPLCKLLEKNETEAFKTLISAGINLNDSDFYQTTHSIGTICIKEAVKHLNIVALDILIKRNPISKKYTTTTTCTLLNEIMNTIRNEDDVTDEILRFIRKLILKGTLPTQDNSFCPSFLHVAAERSLKITSLILQLCPQFINLPTREDITPLHRATAAGREDIIEFLIEKGANKEAKTIQNQTPLLLAIYKNAKSSVIDKLLSLGASKYPLSASTDSPLFHACINKQPGIVEVFKKHCTTKEDSRLFNETIDKASRNKLLKK